MFFNENVTWLFAHRPTANLINVAVQKCWVTELRRNVGSHFRIEIRPGVKSGELFPVRFDVRAPGLADPGVQDFNTNFFGGHRKPGNVLSLKWKVPFVSRNCHSWKAKKKYFMIIERFHFLNFYDNEMFLITFIT